MFLLFILNSLYGTEKSRRKALIVWIVICCLTLFFFFCELRRYKGAPSVCVFRSAFQSISNCDYPNQYICVDFFLLFCPCFNLKRISKNANYNFVIRFLPVYLTFIQISIKFCLKLNWKLPNFNFQFLFRFSIFNF